MKIALFLAMLCGLVGCTVYSPQPLEPEVEWKRLESLRIDNLLAPGAPGVGLPGESLPAFDYSNGLSSEEAAGLAVVLSPALRAVRLKAGIAEAQIIAAGALPNPEVDTKWLVPTNASVWKGEVNAAIDLTQILLRRGLEKERARLHVEEVRWDIAAEEWKTAARAKLAWIDLVYADEALTLFQETRGVRERTLQGIRERQRVGDSSLMQTLLAEVDLAEADREGARLRGQRKLALQALNALLGLPPNHDTRIEKPANPLVYAPAQIDRTGLGDALWRRRPELLAAFKAHEGAERELQIACRKQFPGLKLGPSFERDGSQNLLGFNAALEIPIFNRNQGEIAEKTAARDEARKLFEVELASARADLESALAVLDTSEAELKLTFEELSPRLMKMLEMTQRALQAGDVSLFEVLTMQRRLLEARAEVTKSLRDFHRARVEVDRAAGPKPANVSAPLYPSRGT